MSQCKFYFENFRIPVSPFSPSLQINSNGATFEKINNFQLSDMNFD